MAISKETTNPSLIPLYIWFLEVITVLIFCCVVITLCIIPRPPTYTIINLAIPGTLHNNTTLSMQDLDEVKPVMNSTIILSLLITNSNKAKEIVYDESKITLYKNGSLVGISTLQGFFQSGKSNNTYLVLVNFNHEKIKFGGQNESGTLKIGLETKVRYIILGSTTKLHSLNLEAFVPIDVSGKVELGDEGIKLEPSKHKP